MQLHLILQYWSEMIVGLYFCLYVVLSHQICIQWCIFIYSKWKRHIRYGSCIPYRYFIFQSKNSTHNSFNAVITASKQASKQLVFYWIPFFKWCCSLVTNWNESESTTRYKFTTAIAEQRKISSHDKYLFEFSAIYTHTTQLVANKNKINQKHCVAIVFETKNECFLCF